MPVRNRLGYRFRLHRRSLPGCPDIVFPARRKIIFIHGCFWHGHSCPRGHRIPKSNTPYWLAKIARNKARDLGHLRELRKQGWRILVIWECQLRKTPSVISRLQRFLSQLPTKSRSRAPK